RGGSLKYIGIPEFFLKVDILCVEKNTGEKGPMAEICQDKELEKRCTDPVDDKGFKWARFYHRFEYDPTGENSLTTRGVARYNLVCTLGYQVTFEGLSCFGGLKDGRCSDIECG
ncbi:hypothetical protein PMAYCL1PPCAC_25626, partial [Pristionchus mayeri]